MRDAAADGDEGHGWGPGASEWVPPESELRDAYPEIWERHSPEDAVHERNIADLVEAGTMADEPLGRLRKAHGEILGMMAEAALLQQSRNEAAESRLAEALPGAFGKRMAARVEAREP